MTHHDFNALIFFMLTIIWAFGMINPKLILRSTRRPTRKKLTSIIIILLTLLFPVTEPGEEWMQDNFEANLTALSQTLLSGAAEDGQDVQDEDQNLSGATHPSGELTVHFIDVGQGDATLFQGPDFTMLIDAGRHNRDDVVSYLQTLGIEEIDVIVGTHSHADHIGQIDEILHVFEVEEIWLSGEPHTSRTYENMLEAIDATDVTYHEPRAGEHYDVGSLIIDILNPDTLTGDVHGSSLAVRLRYGEINFVFTGDAEAETEEAIIARGQDIQAQIFHAGHHGSATSNTTVFLEEVQPEVAIYSAEEDNSYEHPHREVVERFEQRGIPLYGTDVYGTMLVTTDGEDYEVVLD
ncbi:ComEC/Rec2 family competence protein [Caldalkalibacillus salinus]|uniref:ComEC/Rec2 family competence protein n=1 Tax=Caldalkalibacillus salinus TaxID=2803787 RepID=UPI0019208A1D|nr:ComEC/Rec2 family competence protein [Caldalkalibacillus salinus]